jgi:uncharacterized metal-binding protein YceD (DUF177 family)
MSIREPAWSVPLTVQDVAAEGQRHHLIADAQARAAVAKVAGLQEVDRLEADLVTVPHGADGLRVTGRVSAMVGQTCVVTLEPMQSVIDEAIDVLFLRHPPEHGDADDDEEAGKVGDERIETLTGGTIDLGAIATEFLILGLDPYPRKPGAAFTPRQVDEPLSSPFAALAALKKVQGSG